jgi:hypothetical protein
MKYRKKPVVVDAVKFTGKNSAEIHRWMGVKSVDGEEPSSNSKGMFIETKEGVMKASVGDFIIKGIKGEFYPCKPDIFHQTYERI